MEIVKKSGSKRISNNPQFVIYEYKTVDREIDGAMTEINGRYPNKDRVKNEISRELIFVLGGVGKIVVEGKEFNLNCGDLAIIAPNERYYFSGKLKLFVANTPKWTPKEHSAVV